MKRQAILEIKPMITLFTDEYMHHQELRSSSEHQANKVQDIKVS